MSDVDRFLPAGPTQSQAEPEQGFATEHRYEGFREWCEERRTQWPTLLSGEFLSLNEAMLVGEMADNYPHNTYKTKKDYSWVPSALWDIFTSRIDPETMLNVLSYFLALLSVLIIADATGESEGRVYRELLLRVLSPGSSCLSQEPDFLGSLDPNDANESSSPAGVIDLVRDLRHRLYIHTRNPK